jgi:hypothetical protein
MVFVILRFDHPSYSDRQIFAALAYGLCISFLYVHQIWRSLIYWQFAVLITYTDDPTIIILLAADLCYHHKSR